MAFISIEGTITRTFYNGKGAEVTESFKKRDGSQGTKRYTLWFSDEHGLSEGTTGKWSGLLGVDVDEWTDKEGNVRHTPKISVNGARADGGRAGQSAPVAAPAPADEPWASSAPADDSLPF
jgi:hypothetical protein